MADVEEQVHETSSNQTPDNVGAPDGMEPVALVVAPERLARVANDRQCESGAKVSRWVDCESSLRTDGDGDAQQSKQDGQGEGLTGEGGIGECKDAAYEDSSPEELVVKGRTARDGWFGRRDEVARRALVAKDLMAATGLKVRNRLVVVGVDEERRDKAAKDLRKDVARYFAQRESSEDGLRDRDCWIDVATRDGASNVCAQGHADGPCCAAARVARVTRGCPWSAFAFAATLISATYQTRSSAYHLHRRAASDTEHQRQTG